MRDTMKDAIVGAAVGAIITGIISILIFYLGNFETQSTLEKNTVKVLSEYFNSVDKDMSYEQALQVIYKENENLKNDISSLQKEKQELVKSKEEITNISDQKYDVTFQNMNLILNGIDSGYSSKVAIINNETFYSQDFLQYLVDNEAVSSNNSKLFIGSVQSEEYMPTSLFQLKPFTNYALKKVTKEEDTYGNVFSEVFKIKSKRWNYSDLMDHVTEYFLDKHYTKFCFEAACSKNADQDLEYQILIYGDGQLLKSIILNRKSKIENYEVDITNVEFLQIVGKSEGSFYPDDAYCLMINPYLYP